MSPLLSVVVPTHNRATYAFSCIESVLAHDCADLQLVVTDTSSDGHLEELLRAPGCAFLDDSRIVYKRIHTPSNLTVNHNDAMALARGEYVCLIGDDDCITSGAIAAARWASTNQVALVSHTQKAVYAWPDFRSKFSRAGHASRLYVPRRAGSARWRNSNQDLNIALARALQGTEAMPRCYHGIVRRELLEQIKTRTGAYFHGSSPDMSAAVAMACLVDTYCEVDTPLTIPGISSGSNSGRSAMNTHKGELAEERQTSGFEDRGWTLGVPRFFAVETVWAHAGLETLSKLNPAAVATFNYARLIALCNLSHPDFAGKSDQALQEIKALIGRDVAPDVALEMKRERWVKWRRLARRLMVPTAANGRRFFAPLPTVAAAARRYEDYARDAGLGFQPPA